MKAAGVLASVVSGVLVLGATSQAAITVTDLYQFGEADGTGIVDGTALKVETVSSVGSGKMWTQPWPNSSAKYSSDVPAASKLPASVTSTLSVQLNGSVNDAFQSSTGVANAGVIDNFGMQVWVKPAALNSTQVVAYNGNNGSGGYGLILANNQVRIHYGGVGSRTVAAPGLVAGEWNHLAAVRDTGVTKLYVNGQEITNPASPINLVPKAPLYNVKVGNYGFIAADTAYTGYIDNLSFFTFEPGAFTPADLQVAVPEPSMLGILGVAGIALMRRRA